MHKWIKLTIIFLTLSLSLSSALIPYVIYKIELPLGYDTPLYIYNSQKFETQGIEWLNYWDNSKTFDIGYFILNHVILHISGLNNLLLYKYLPIALILFILISYLVYSRHWRTRYSFIFSVFWLPLFYLSREAQSNLLAILIINFIIYYIYNLDKKESYFLIGFLLAGLFFIHLLVFGLVFLILLTYIFLTKKFIRKYLTRTIPTLLIFILTRVIFIIRDLLNLSKRIVSGVNIPSRSFEYEWFVYLFGLAFIFFFFLSFIFYVKNSRNKDFVLFFSITMVLLSLASIFNLYYVPYYRYLFLIPAPLFLPYLFNLRFNRNYKVLLTFFLLCLLIINLGIYNSRKTFYTDEDAVKSLFDLKLNHQNKIFLVFPVKTGVGNWILATQGDFVFYGEAIYLCIDDKPPYDKNSYIAYRNSYDSLKMNYVLDEISDYNIYIIDNFYKDDSISDKYLETTNYTGLHTLKLNDYCLSLKA